MAAVAFAVLISGCAAAGRGGPGVPDAAGADGTFLQPTTDQLEWDGSRWERLLDRLQAAGVGTVVMQWTEHGVVSFADDRDGRPSLAAELLERAGDRGMGVWLGLHEDGDWWSRVDGPRDSLVPYLRERRHRSLSLARRLRPLAAEHDAFRGWYLPEEVDDRNWRREDRTGLLRRHLDALADSLHAVTPDRPVAVSGFTTGSSTPEEVRGFWSRLLGQADVDAVFFQDGVGTGVLTLERLPAYLEAVRGAADARDRELRVVVELFDDRGEGGAPHPADLDRVVDQLRLAHEASTGPVLAFSFPDYMVPEAGDDARRLYRSYLGWLR